MSLFGYMAVIPQDHGVAVIGESFTTLFKQRRKADAISRNYYAVSGLETGNWFLPLKPAGSNQNLEHGLSNNSRVKRHRDRAGASLSLSKTCRLIKTDATLA